MSVSPEAIPRRGYQCVILAALLWAVSGTSAKFLFQEGVTPLQLVQMRAVLSSAILLVWLAFRHPSLLRISSDDIPYFAVLGIAGMAMVHFTYLFTISKIHVAAAILMQYLAPSFIALYSVVFVREKLSALTLLAVVGATGGCYLVVGAYNLDLLALNKTGLIGGLFAGLAFAFYSLYSERGMRRYNPWTVLFYALTFAALFWNVAHFFWSAAPAPMASFSEPYSPVQWAWILYISILGTVLPFGLYFEGISLIRSTRASITATLEPIVAGMVSFLFLGEAFEPLQLLGGGLVVASVVLLQLRREYDDKTPALVRARTHSGSMTHQHDTDHHTLD